MNLFKELNRRNVLKIAVAYIVVAWILVQVVNNIVMPLHLPEWTPTLVIVLLGVGFPIALIIAWAFEKPPTGSSGRRQLKPFRRPPLRRRRPLPRLRRKRLPPSPRSPSCPSPT